MREKLLLKKIQDDHANKIIDINATRIKSNSQLEKDKETLIQKMSTETLPYIRSRSINKKFIEEIKQYHSAGNFKEITAKICYELHPKSNILISVCTLMGLYNDMIKK
jgi:hypothetical protein